MKTSRYSDPQILSILRQAEGGMPVPELCREHGMSSATFYTNRRHSRLMPDYADRLNIDSIPPFSASL